MTNLLTKSVLFALYILIFSGQVLAKDKEWNVYTWGFDEAIEARVLSPYKLEDLKRFGIDFQIRQKDRYAHFDFSAEGLIEQKAIPFNKFKNAAFKEILLHKTSEMFAAQETESRRVIVTGIIKDPNVMREFGEDYLVPFKVISEVKNRFKKNPSEFIAVYESPSYGEVKAIVGKIVITYIDQNNDFDEETHTVEATCIFIASKGKQIAVQDFLRSDGYAFFKNKEGKLFFLLRSSAYEGSGIESYLINADGLKLVASVGAGV
jgi:hypothetical protein